MSGKKNLLNEAQVRKFMKLANLKPFASSFVNEADYRDDDSDELDELRTGRTGALGPRSGRANPGHGRGQGEASDGSLFEEEDPAELEGEIGHDLGDDSLEGDEEAMADEEEIEGEMEPEGGEGRMVSVDDFLAALETALEDAIGDEVEIDSDEMEDEEEVEMGVEMEPEPGGEEMEMGAEEEMMEGWEHPKSASGASNTNKGSKQHPDHRRRKVSGAGLASQGPGLVKEEDDDDDDDEGSKKGEYKRRGKSAEHPEGKKAGDVGGHYKAYEKKDESVKSTNDLVEEITKRVAARILKSALRK